jgi:hypothetical protein
LVDTVLGFVKTLQINEDIKDIELRIKIDASSIL